MTLAGFVTLLLLNEVPALVSDALTARPPVTRVELLDVKLALAQGCVLRAVKAEPVERSGVIGLTLSGREASRRPCRGTGWARVRAFAPAWLTVRAVRSGERLEGALERGERELRGEVPLETVPTDAVAKMSLSRGTVLSPRHLRPGGPQPGDRVTVVVQVGDLRVEQAGTALACPGAVCARLDNGRRLEGVLADGKVLVRR